ncbi:MAG: glycosyltransferase family 4 protein, partial [Brasilonema sp.]
LIDAFLPISAFSAKFLPPIERMQVIYGGVQEKFIQDQTETEREKKVLYVGRIMPHKGINYLIEAVDGNISLEIIGRIYNKKFFSLLQKLAKGKRVTFINNANDDDIIKSYKSSLVTVLPSVYVDVYSTQHPVSELLGLVLLESMACRTPVICTDVGGMPEIVRDGITGFVVPPNNPGAIRERINWLLDNPEKAYQMGQQARNQVLKEFTWDSIAERCLEAYGQV